MNANREILSNVMRPTPSWRVETRTRLSTLFSIAAILFVLLLAAAPFVVSRGVVQDLFFILTMLALGMVFARLRAFPDNAGDVINRVVLYVCLPAAVLTYVPRLQLDASLLGLMAMVFHKAFADVSVLWQQHSGTAFWAELARYLFKNLAG